MTLTPPPACPPATIPRRSTTALLKRKLKALELTLRILAVTQEVKPPAAGKQFRQLMRGIKLSVFGDSCPDKVMAHRRRR